MKHILTLFVFLSFGLAAQDTLLVYFLVGSKPKWSYRHEERRWFGGIHGGHVGLGSDTSRILNFFHRGRLHIFPRKTEKRMNSVFALHEKTAFARFHGGHADSMKLVIIGIPVTADKKRKFDSITAAYLSRIPYDYAFFGMRCAASTYEILSQTGIVRAKSRCLTIAGIFYPRKLRRLLIRRAREEGWTVKVQEGTHRRRWERD